MSAGKVYTEDEVVTLVRAAWKHGARTATSFFEETGGPVNLERSELTEAGALNLIAGFGALGRPA